jgi:chromosomal replication initiation ATPase DnaA
MMTHAQKSRLMSLLRDPENDDLLDIARGLDTFKPERVKTPREKINELQRLRNVLHNEWVQGEIDKIIASADEPQHDPLTVFEVVYKVTGITRDAMTPQNRQRMLVDTRHLTVGLMAYHCLQYSMSDIAGMFERDHATGLHSNRMFHTLTDTDPAFRAKREKCEAMLREKKA